MTTKEAYSLTTDDILEIHQLNARYALAIDDLVPSAAADWAETFAPDGAFTLYNSAGEVQLQAQGTEQLKALHENFPERANIRHWFTNLFVEADVGGARLTCYLISLRTNPDPPTAAEIARTSVYRDHLRKLNGAWKFTTRDVTLDRGSSH